MRILLGRVPHCLCTFMFDLEVHYYDDDFVLRQPKKETELTADKVN
jgi:hypothetical protein